METVVIIVLLVILLSVWVISARRKLTMLDENICNAMGQIGIQISSRFDALMALLNLAKNYAPEESRKLMESVASKRVDICGGTVPEQLREQESLLDDALSRVTELAERTPELAGEKNYIKYLDALSCYEKMLQTGKLIYNDSVHKFNREVSRIPTSILAGILGFQKKSHLETESKSQNIQG